jgi:hypothetical protein
MRCARCHRPLNVPAATVTTRHGASTYGPVCAERMGLASINRAALKTSVRRVKPTVAVEDSAQMGLWVDDSLPTDTRARVSPADATT